MTLELQPITIKDAKDFVNAHHRHHKAPLGAKFCIAVNDGQEIVGVVMVGRPVARGNDDGWTVEVTRCCVKGSVPHVASKLYAAAWRAARAMGYKRLVSYTLASEKGTSLIASGWKVIGQVKGRSWNCPSRPRFDKHPLDDKTLWAME